MLSQAALVSIGAYQRWLSPRKGYGCAYRIAHGGTGCSGFAKAVIAERGLLAARPALHQRFAACREAALTLQAQGRNEEDRRRDRWYDYCVPSDCGCGDCRPRSGSGLDTTPDGCACAPDL